jgi:hypothetical protein
MSDVWPAQWNRSTGRMLRALADHPRGLSTEDLRRVAKIPTGHARPLIHRQLRLGRVRRAGSRSASTGGLLTVWQITGEGVRHLGDTTVQAAPLSEMCILIMAMYGRPASAAEVRDWMEREGKAFTRAPGGPGPEGACPAGAASS